MTRAPAALLWGDDGGRAGGGAPAGRRGRAPTGTRRPSSRAQPARRSHEPSSRPPVQAQVEPVEVPLLDQADLPPARPSLQLSLPTDRCGDVDGLLEVHESREPVATRVP